MIKDKSQNRLRTFIIIQILAYFSYRLCYYANFIYLDFCDFRQRWAEGFYFINGINPIQMANYSDKIGEIVTVNEKNIAVVKGTMSELGYMPWQYVYSIVLANPFIKQNIQLIIQYILYMIIIIQLLVVTYKMLSKDLGRTQSIFLIVQMQFGLQFVMSLNNGNYGMIIPAIELTQTVIFVENYGRKRETSLLLQIILMSIACIKPQIGALMCLVYLMYYPLKTQIASQIFIGIPWIIQQIILRENPLKLLADQFNNGANNYNSGIICGILNPLVRVGLIERSQAIIIQVITLTLIVMAWTIYCKQKQKQNNDVNIKQGYVYLNLQIVPIAQLFWMYVNKCDYTIGFISVILMIMAYKKFGFEVRLSHTLVAVAISIITLNRCDFVEFYNQQLINLVFMIYSDTFIMICYLLWWVQQILDLKKLMNNRKTSDNIDTFLVLVQGVQLMLQISDINLV